MSTGSTSTRKAGARRKAGAARAEKNGTPRTIDFRGITLTLPHALPGTAYFDFAEISEDDSDIAAQVRLLKSLIGADQVTLVRNKIAEDGLPLSDMPQIVTDLFDDAMDAFGLSTGESSASPES